jgi:hypothetical protein
MLQQELSEQCTRQDTSTTEFAQLIEDTLKGLTEDICTHLDSMIDEVVETKVKERVRDQVFQRLITPIQRRKADI